MHMHTVGHTVHSVVQAMHAPAAAACRRGLILSFLPSMAFVFLVLVCIWFSLVLCRFETTRVRQSSSDSAFSSP